MLHFLCTLLAVLCSLNILQAAEISELAPPAYEVTDPASVNVATGQLSPRLTDVHIGADRGLAHTLTSYTSNFVNWEGGPLGFTDNFNGVVYRTIMYKPNPYDLLGVIYSMRVSDGSTTADFKLLGGGQYEAFGDRRFELRWIAGIGYVLTKPDGTEVRFSKGNGISQSTPPDEANNRYAMTQIRRPDGFTIDIASRGGYTNPRYSVKTNTGYQLKFIYEPHNRPIDPSKQTFQPNNSFIPAADSQSWSTDLPRYIYGINNSEIYCPHSSTNCSIPLDWPRATHTWPDGMPRAAYIGDSTFSVIQPNGATTHFKNRAIDIALNSSGNPIPGYLPANTHFRPRIVEIEHPHGEIFEYNYRNLGSYSGFFIPQYISRGEAQLSGATSTNGGSSWGYSIGNVYSPHGQLDNILNGSGGFKGVNRVVFQTRYSAIVEVDTWNMFVNFMPSSNGHYDWRVHMSRDKLGGGTTYYEYDDRGNITARITNGITTAAEYPSSCNATNRKYCNKPEWVSDGRGNKTFFTYHADSGQVATATPPADSRGITPMKVFTYTQHYAHVKNASGQRVQVSDPIWLLTRERRCADSQHTGSACAGNDEISIRYEYDHDNLHLTEMAVSSQQDQKTLTTCYQYDRYGNRIGETPPKANPSGCNQ